jgi:hypothetical protein
LLKDNIAKNHTTISLAHGWKVGCHRGGVEKSGGCSSVHCGDISIVVATLG